MHMQKEMGIWAYWHYNNNYLAKVFNYTEQAFRLWQVFLCKCKYLNHKFPASGQRQDIKCSDTIYTKYS